MVMQYEEYEVPTKEPFPKLLEREKYFDDFLIEKMKYQMETYKGEMEWVIPFGSDVDGNVLIVRYNFQNKSKCFVEMMSEEVDDGKGRFLSDCSSGFMKVMECFLKCRMGRGKEWEDDKDLNNVNVKDEIEERFKFFDCLFRYFNSECQRNVTVTFKEDSIVYDYHHDLFNISGIVSDCENGLLDERFISGFKCFMAKRREKQACYFMIDRNFFYYTLLNESLLANTFKINHSTFEGMCEILILLNNVSGFQATLNYSFSLDELIESYYTINLPTSFPFQDEIFLVTHKYLREQIKDVKLGAPFLFYNQGNFRYKLSCISRKRFKIDNLHKLHLERYVHKPLVNLDNSNKFTKQSKTKKSKYYSIKNIEMGRINQMNHV